MSTKTLNLMQQLVMEMSKELSPEQFNQFLQQVQQEFFKKKSKNEEISNQNETPSKKEDIIQTIQEIRKYMPQGKITQADIDEHC